MCRACALALATWRESVSSWSLSVSPRQSSVHVFQVELEVYLTRPQASLAALLGGREPSVTEAANSAGKGFPEAVYGFKVRFRHSAAKLSFLP